MKKQMSNKIDLCSACCRFTHKYGKTSINDLYMIDQKKFSSDWKKLFIRICREKLEMNKSGANMLFEELVRGNWERIHLTEDEKHLGLAYWLDKFLSDVFYCSDRWSIDRLTRVHWMYRNIISELKIVQGDDE